MNIEGFAFVITLAGVVNGLGIVRWVSAFGEYLSRSESRAIRLSWTYAAQAIFQFLMHVVLWWSMWGVREAGVLNFVSYLYLLAGPVLLYLATSVLLPSLDADVDLDEVYFNARPVYYTVLSLLWLWAIFLWPVLIGVFAPTVPLLMAYLTLSVVLRLSERRRLHDVLVPAQIAILVVFVVAFALELGGVGRDVTQGG